MVNAVEHILAFLAGAYLVFLTALSAIRTLVVPRSSRDRISKFIFVVVQRFFAIGVHFAPNYTAKDRRMAFYAPVSLLVMVVAWLILVAIGYTGMFLAMGIDSWDTAFTTSGSSLLTLGIRNTTGFLITNLAFSEASIGLILIALLIAYLPSMYSTSWPQPAWITITANHPCLPRGDVQHDTGAKRLRRSRDGKMLISSRYFATVRRATSMPLRFSMMVSCSSL